MKTIHNNAQARVFRSAHPAAYFMRVGSMAQSHKLMRIASAVFLVIGLVALCILRGVLSAEAAATIILTVATIMFVVSAGLVFAASDQAYKLLSAIRPDDIPEINAAGIFKVRTVVKGNNGGDK